MLSKPELLQRLETAGSLVALLWPLVFVAWLLLT